MLEKLKLKVLKANQDLVKHNLVILSWGNVSGYDPLNKLVVIKPSGVPYDELTPEKMVVVDLNGNVIEGELKPSSDTLTHIEIYKNFTGITSVVHTHSKWATSFAQARLEIKIHGTTHADYFSSSIPLTRRMTTDEIKKDYEKNTGKVIVETFNNNDLDYNNCPAVLVHEHGPFTWGTSIEKAVENSVVLEFIAEMAYIVGTLQTDVKEMNDDLINKHFDRKHGKTKYYGQ